MKKIISSDNLLAIIFGILGLLAAVIVLVGLAFGLSHHVVVSTLWIGIASMLIVVFLPRKKSHT